jgi:hypothetical protein
MTFTASDVSSLAQSLRDWEHAEYGACAFVAIACAGEYIADFTNLLTAGDERRKRRLAKRSTLLLIISLAFELFCLVQTNSLSGQLIGSLSDKATNADAKAQSALDKSNVADGKAEQANKKAEGALSSLTEAESDAGKAQTLASSALGAATAASIRAGKAETSLGKAESEAKDAESSASSALTLSREAKEIADRLKWRTLTVQQQSDIVDGLSGFSGHPEVDVSSYGMDGEGALLATEIMSVIHRGTGTMPIDSRVSKIVTGSFEMGVTIRGPLIEMPFMKRLQYLLQTVGKVDSVFVNPPIPRFGSVIGGNATMGGTAMMSGGGGGGGTVPATIPLFGTVSIFVGLKPIPELSTITP